MENTLAVLHGAQEVRIEKRLTPQVGPEDLLIRVRATGLCGSDLHYYQHGRNGDFALAHPMCLGHEASGEVVEVGEDVITLNKTIVKGSRVIIEPGQGCASCSYCLEGRYNLCSQMRFASSAKTVPHLDGTLQQYLVWPAKLCHILPESVSFYTGALVEPMAVVLQAFTRTHLTPGQSVLVLGAGAVGLLACAAAKAYGASFVAAVDIDPHRLAFGKKCGWVDETYCLQRAPGRGPFATRKEEDADAVLADRTQAENILKHFASASSIISSEEGFDVAYECTGVPSCINMSIFASKKGGRVGLIGMGNPIVTLALGAAALREVDIIGVFRYANMFPKAIRLLASTLLRQVTTSGSIEDLFSHRFTLDKASEAFETLKKGQSSDGKRVVKVLIVEPEAGKV